MLRIILTAFIILSTFDVFSQVDYNDLRKQYKVTCGRTDSASDMQSLKFLDSLSQYEINDGLDVYLYDYGMTKYLMHAKWNNEKDLIESIGYLEEGYSIRRTSDFAWNIAFSWFVFGKCEKALVYLDQYLELRKKEGLEIDYKQVSYIQTSCGNQQ